MMIILQYVYADGNGNDDNFAAVRGDVMRKSTCILMRKRILNKDQNLIRIGMIMITMLNLVDYHYVCFFGMIKVSTGG